MGIGRDILYGLGAAATSPLWGAGLLKSGKWRTDWAGRLGRTAAAGALAAGDDGRPTLLLHGVSVGEINLIRNLVADLEVRTPPLRLVVAAATNTGFDRAQALYGERHAVVRFPYDFSFAVQRFLDAVRPDVVGLVELEVWPNFMDACAARGAPVAVINGRLTQRSFRGYRKIAPLVRPVFAALSVAAVQTESYARRFEALGVPPERVRVLDTMKWDTAIIEDTVEGADALAAEMGIDRGRPLIVAGSTAPGEDRLLIESCPAEAQLLIAPRKPEWFEAVMKVAPHAVRRSGGGRRAHGDDPRPQSVGFEAGGVGERVKVFLLDTIGELRKAYSLADVCIVGRSFSGKLFGSDMMEPIALGKPTVIGPYFGDFADTMAALSDAGGIIVSDDPGKVIRELLANRAVAWEVAASGREVILSRQGSTRRHAELLLELLGATRRCSAPD